MCEAPDGDAINKQLMSRTTNACGEEQETLLTQSGECVK